MLERLTSAEGDILENVELVENLETAKAIGEEVKIKVENAKETKIAIDHASEQYRPSAQRGALIFFLMNELHKIHTFYMFSLEAYLEVIVRAIKAVADKYRAANAPAFPDKKDTEENEEGKEEGEEEKADEAAEEEEQGDEEPAEPAMSPRTLKKRVDDLKESITYFSFNFVKRGMLEVHKLVFSTMLTLRVQVYEKVLNPDEVNALIQAIPDQNPGNMPESLQ